MSRKVFITSDISIDERLAEAAEESPEAALLWPWLLTALDDWGRSVAEPKRLKYAVFPAFASVTPQAIEEALALFAQVGLITHYAVDGKAYFAVPQETWFKYQTHIRTEKRESDRSRYPAPPVSSSRDCAQVREDARDRAQVRALADKSQPSPSPSPSPSPTLSPDGHGSSPERERMRDTDVDVAAEAARALMASAPSATAATPANAIPSNITPLPIATRSPTTAAAADTATSMAANTATGTKATARVHDPVWDACIAAMGGAPSNRVERGKWAKGIQALKESLASDGSPPESFASEIAVRAARYRARFGPSVPLNPMALAGNWTTVAHDIPLERQEGQRHGQGHGNFGRSWSTPARRSGGPGGGRSGRPAIGSPAYYAAALAQQSAEQSAEQSAQQASEQSDQRAARQTRDGRGDASEGQHDAFVG